MASLTNKQYYVIVNQTTGYVDPGTASYDVPKLYTPAGAKRSITHKNKHAVEGDRWEIVPVVIGYKTNDVN